MKRRRKRLNTREAQRARNTAAMPDVKRIVKRHGRRAVTNCLAKIKARDREVDRLTKLKRQVVEMEKGLR